jgi:hypothetical protein
MDFPVTRSVLDQLQGWVDAFSRRHSAAKRVPVQSSFRWEPVEKNAEVAQVAKAVRAASALRAAMLLADARHTAECVTLLRVVADFAAEIIYLGEGLLEGRLTEDQERFVTQHFDPMPTDPDELAAREREYYVGRKQVTQAHRRIMERTGAPADQFIRIAAYLNKNYDSFVHGSNSSAMELYDARRNSFMVRGHMSARFACSAKVTVSAKLLEFLMALRFMAIARRDEKLEREIRIAADALSASGEDSGLPCEGLA